MTYDDLRLALDELCSRYTRHELLVGGNRFGATLAPVNSVEDLLRFEHLDARRFWVDTVLPASSTGVRRAGGPLTVDGERLDQPTAVPAVDEHGAAAARRAPPCPYLRRRPDGSEPTDGTTCPSPG